MEPMHYLTDDRDHPEDQQNELVISMGGNGDWYVAVVSKGSETCIGRAVRLCTSGGASSAAPGLTTAVAQAYYALDKVNHGGMEHKRTYLYAYEAEFHRLVKARGAQRPVTPGIIDGMWLNAHMHYGRRTSVEDGAKAFYEEVVGDPAEYKRRLDLMNKPDPKE